MLRQRPFLVELLTAAGLIAAPFVLPYLGFTPTTINRILVWGLFGIGFDILFGFTGLLSFGQSAFFGTGGMVAAYLLTVMNFPHVITALVTGMVVAAGVGYLVGLVALRRTGIYFAMITVAIAEVFFFVEFNPLADFTGGENGLPGVPTPSFNLGFTTLQFDNGWSLYQFIAFVIAAAYAGFAGGLLGVLQAFMPPDAFTFDTSGQLVMQTAIGGRGTLFGPLVGAAVWLSLQDFLQSALDIVFVMLVCFLRGGIVGGLVDLYGYFAGRPHQAAADEAPSGLTAEAEQKAAAAEISKLAEPAPLRSRHAEAGNCSGPIL